MGGGVKSTRIGPDETGKDAHELSDVCTVTALDPAVAAPIVKPLMVTMNAAVALIAAPEVVSTTAVLLVTPHVMLKPTILLAPAATKGVIEGAKKLGGYDRMKEPPGGMAESTEKVRITAAFGLRAIRFEDSMKNCCTFAPNKAATETIASVDVEMRNPPKSLAIVKIVKPEQVTVIEPLGTGEAVVITIFPLRMNDTEALPSEGLDTSHLPVLPMNGK